ncbi:hypothetical protein ACTMU2_19665 [Cupriavidus basilensis]
MRDGEVIAAAEDERFTYIKHGKRPVPFSTWELPYHAIDYCLAEAGIALADVDHIAYSYDPSLLLGEQHGDETLSLPLEPSRAGAGGRWQRPGSRYSVVHRQRAAPACLRRAASPAGPVPGRAARRAVSAGTSWNTTWRMRPAPSGGAVRAVCGADHGRRGERATTRLRHIRWPGVSPHPADRPAGFSRAAA